MEHIRQFVASATTLAPETDSMADQEGVHEDA
jgi:hypothetical protein